MSKIKVLHLLQSCSFSGAENVVVQICKMFQKQTDIEMIYCSKDGEIRSKLEKENIKFLPLKEFDYCSVKKAINIYNPNVIHAHDAAASVMACICSNNINIISHIHGNHENMRHYTLKSILMLIASKRFNRIYWVSKSAYKEYIFKSRVQSKSKVLINVIDKNDILKKARMEKNQYHYDIVILGRVNKIKNPLRALEIIKRCVKKNNKLNAAFIGEGELLSECQEFVINNNLTNNVDFLGYVSNPLGILSQSKLLLMTSIYEGTPMCALEAMALDIPIVSTPTDGLVDLIANEETGYYSNDNDVLVENICKLLENTNLWEKTSYQTKIRFDKLMDLDKYKRTLYNDYTMGG